jgi:hypothetical protein
MSVPSPSINFYGGNISLAIILDPEDGGDMFNRNVRLSPNYTLRYNIWDHTLRRHRRENLKPKCVSSFFRIGCYDDMTGLLFYEEENLAHTSTYILSRVELCAWLIRRVLGLDDWICCYLYVHTTRYWQLIQRCHWSTHFTVHRHTRIRILSFR